MIGLMSKEFDKVYEELSLLNEGSSNSFIKQVINKAKSETTAVIELTDADFAFLKEEPFSDYFNFLKERISRYDGRRAPIKGTSLKLATGDSLTANYTEDNVNFIDNSDVPQWDNGKGVLIPYAGHHIIFRCFGGIDEPENLIALSPPMHAKAHELFCSCLDKYLETFNPKDLTEATKFANFSAKSQKTDIAVKKLFSVLRNTETDNKSLEAILEYIKGTLNGKYDLGQALNLEYKTENKDSSNSQEITLDATTTAKLNLESLTMAVARYNSKTWRSAFDDNTGNATPNIIQRTDLATKNVRSNNTLLVLFPVTNKKAHFDNGLVFPSGSSTKDHNTWHWADRIKLSDMAFSLNKELAAFNLSLLPLPAELGGYTLDADAPDNLKAYLEPFINNCKKCLFYKIDQISGLKTALSKNSIFKNFINDVSFKVLRDKKLSDSIHNVIITDTNKKDEKLVLLDADNNELNIDLTVNHDASNIKTVDLYDTNNKKFRKTFNKQLDAALYVAKKLYPELNDDALKAKVYNINGKFGRSSSGNKYRNYYVRPTSDNEEE